MITGCSSGFGREIATAAAAAGHRVMATARRPEQLADLAGSVPAERFATAALDVTDQRQVDAAVAATVERFGRIDVLVNNAGFGIRGAVEETGAEQLQKIFDTNVFGVARMCRAVLPLLRAQGGGHIIQIGSVGGVSATLGGSSYAATKFALEGLSEGLALEVAPFGISVTIIEPGPFRTEFAGSSQGWAEPMPEYEPILADARQRFTRQHDRQPGDPKKAAEVIVRLAQLPEPPLRLPLGPEAFDRIRAVLTQRLADLDGWEELGRHTSFPQGHQPGDG
nr:SDR family oxidoreductase [Nakamurella aerolata]